MKTFTQFQEDAYKPPKTVNKVAKQMEKDGVKFPDAKACLLYTSPSPRDDVISRMPSSA